MDTPQKKLDFARPPVGEVVLSVHFEQLNRLLTPYLGEIWQEFKKVGFVRIIEQPPVRPAVERFPTKIGETKTHIGDAPIGPRIWFIRDRDNKVIQTQRDRFTFNWRKSETNPVYPGFSAILGDFEEFYKCFRQTLEKQEIGDITPLQYELSYIDQLFSGDGWGSLDDVGKIYNFFVDAQPPDSFWAQADFVTLRTSFPVEDLRGRLHLAISDSLRRSDQKQTLQTSFTLRGLPEALEYEAMIAWFKAARNRIRDKFSSLFTEDIQTQVWGRK